LFRVVASFQIVSGFQFFLVSFIAQTLDIQNLFSVLTRLSDVEGRMKHIQGGCVGKNATVDLSLIHNKDRVDSAGNHE
jgi:hypothetical protein